MPQGPGAFIRKVRVPVKGKNYYYYWLVKSIRQGQKVRQKKLKYLGKNRPTLDEALGMLTDKEREIFELGITGLSLGQTRESESSADVKVELVARVNGTTIWADEGVDPKYIEWLKESWDDMHTPMTKDAIKTVELISAMGHQASDLPGDYRVGGTYNEGDKRIVVYNVNTRTRTSLFDTFEHELGHDIYARMRNNSRLGSVLYEMAHNPSFLEPQYEKDLKKAVVELDKMEKLLKKSKRTSLSREEHGTAIYQIEILKEQINEGRFNFERNLYPTGVVDFDKAGWGWSEAEMLSKEMSDANWKQFSNIHRSYMTSVNRLKAITRYEPLPYEADKIGSKLWVPKEEAEVLHTFQKWRNVSANNKALTDYARRWKRNNRWQYYNEQFAEASKMFVGGNLLNTTDFRKLGLEDKEDVFLKDRDKWFSRSYSKEARSEAIRQWDLHEMVGDETNRKMLQEIYSKKGYGSLFDAWADVIQLELDGKLPEEVGT